MDIASSIYKLAEAIIRRGIFIKTDIIPSYTVTPTSTPQSISMNDYPTGMKVSYVVLKLRSLGTATFIAVGRAGANAERLTIVGEIYEAESPKGSYLDTKDIMISSDSSGAIVEVGGVLIPAGFLP